MKRFSVVACLIFFAAAMLAQCGKDDPTGPAPGYTVIAGTVFSAHDSAAVSDANIVVVDANTNAPVIQGLSDANGHYALLVLNGTYFLEITAQGYLPSPPVGGAPLPFSAAGDTAHKDVYLNADPSSVGTASLGGRVMLGGTGLSGALVVASNIANATAYSTSSGPDGFYVLYNVEPGTYVVRSYRSAYQQVDSLLIALSADNAYRDRNLSVVADSGAALSGSITYLASKNSSVDITLTDPATGEAIPGLYTFGDTSGGADYRLAGIPAGTFIVWASYRNDGYVVDPDWIAKNGLPTVSFTTADTAKTMNFSVTDAIELLSPTNPADTILPVAIVDSTPAFSWDAYPGAKEYVIEVINSRGETIWGGYTAAGAIRHNPITEESVVFNFDGSATEALRSGAVYRWKVYADDSNDPGVQTLISASEDQLGLFEIVP